MTATAKMTIWVDAPFIANEAIMELSAQGHTIVPLDTDNPVPDLILSTRAWNWNDTLWPYLTVALKAARKAKGHVVGTKRDHKSPRQTRKRTAVAKSCAGAATSERAADQAAG